MVIKTMIYLKKDSRDKLFDFSRKFGQATNLPVDLFFDTNIPDVVQLPGDVRCTCLTVCDIATDLTGILYDVNDLFSRVPNDENGAEPKKVIKEAIDQGLKRLDNGKIEFPFKSYWTAHTGRYDAFDNVRSALDVAQRGIALWTPWYVEWNGKVRLPEGQNLISFHMYEIEGVKVVNGEVVLILEAWLGRKLEIGRKEFNKVMGAFFSSTAVLSDSNVDVRRDKTILETIVDILLNFINSFKLPENKLSFMEQPKTVEQSKSKLYTIAKRLVGKHLTLDASVPKETGCAQAMSYILKETGYNISKGGISGTYTLYEWLVKNFHKTDKLEPGCILISVTGTGNGKVRGHVGVVLDDGIIASNNSSTGLLDTHWKYENWIAYYQQVGKLKTVIFKEKSVV